MADQVDARVRRPGVECSTALDALFPPGIRTALAPLNGASAEAAKNSLHPREAAAIANAVSSRVQQFATGRWLARQLLQKLGVASAALVVGPDRAPQWPQTVAGSITHTHELCGVSVGDRSTFGGIGLDLELATPLERTLWPLVLRPEEQSELQSVGEPETEAKLIFSLKECFFKCQWPVTKRWLEFLDVRIDLNRAAGEFGVSVLGAKRAAHEPTRLGNMLRIGNHFACGMVWHQDGHKGRR